MRQNLALAAFVAMLLFVGASVSSAQTLQFKVGDEVEGYSTYLTTPTHWGKGKIIQVDPSGQHKGPYLVRFEADNYEEWLFAGSVRPRAGQTAAVQPENQNTDDNQTTTNGGAFKLGDRVDVFYRENQGKSRGTIIEVGDGRYRVHYDGCKDYFDEWVDRTLVRSPAQLSAAAPEVKFLVGKWSMSTVGISRVAVAWGKSNDIQINGDGTYIWYQEGGKPPVKGKWMADAKIQGADTGIQKYDGVLVKDSAGQEWKVYRFKSTDNIDRITIQRACSGSTDVGHRVR